MEPYRTRSVAIPEHYQRFEHEIRARERHLDILVVTWVVMGIFYVLYGLGLSTLIVLAVGSLPDDSDPALRVVMPVLAVAVLLACIGMAVWYLLTAWGLHRRTRSARISSYILSGILAATVCLLPLSLYAYWVLVGSVADMAFGRFEKAPEGPAVQASAPAPAAPAKSRERKETGPRGAVVVPPENQPGRPGVGTYPRPDVSLRTPPTGVPRYVRPASKPPPSSPKKDLNTMDTVDEMPAPRVKKREGS